jgi:hypothetical protein
MQEIIQTALIAVCLGGAAFGAFLAFKHVGRWAFRRFDEHRIHGHARSVEREAKQREKDLRKWSMAELKGTKGSAQ